MNAAINLPRLVGALSAMLRLRDRRLPYKGWNPDAKKIWDTVRVYSKGRSVWVEHCSETDHTECCRERFRDGTLAWLRAKVGIMEKDGESLSLYAPLERFYKEAVAFLSVGTDSRIVPLADEGEAFSLVGGAGCRIEKQRVPGTPEVPELLRVPKVAWTITVPSLPELSKAIRAGTRCAMPWRKWERRTKQQSYCWNRVFVEAHTDSLRFISTDACILAVASVESKLEAGKEKRVRSIFPKEALESFASVLDDQGPARLENYRGFFVFNAHNAQLIVTDPAGQSPEWERVVPEIQNKMTWTADAAELRDFLKKEISPLAKWKKKKGEEVPDHEGVVITCKPDKHIRHDIRIVPDANPKKQVHVYNKVKEVSKAGWTTAGQFSGLPLRFDCPRLIKALEEYKGDVVIYFSQQKDTAMLRIEDAEKEGKHTTVLVGIFRGAK